MHRSLVSALVFVAASSCATAKLVGDPAFTPPDRHEARTVVIEPLFEEADWQARLIHDPTGYTTPPGFRTNQFQAGPNTREVLEKPFFAKTTTLDEVYLRVVQAIAQKRPTWRVLHTAQANSVTGTVTVIRTIMKGDEILESDRTMKHAAFGFGLVILPLQILVAFPVQETIRVFGRSQRFDLSAELVRANLIKYPTQPDAAVQIHQPPHMQYDLGLDVSFEEGLFADERPRANVLIDGFVDQLSSAMISLVEDPASGEKTP